MNKIKIRLDTQNDIIEFVNIAKEIEEFVALEDGTHFRVNAKSLMGVMYGVHEFNELYVWSDCEKLSSLFGKFMF